MNKVILTRLTHVFNSDKKDTIPASVMIIITDKIKAGLSEQASMVRENGHQHSDFIAYDCCWSLATDVTVSAILSNSRYKLFSLNDKECLLTRCVEDLKIPVKDTQIRVLRDGFIIMGKSYLGTVMQSPLIQFSELESSEPYLEILHNADMTHAA